MDGTCSPVRAGRSSPPPSGISHPAGGFARSPGTIGGGSALAFNADGTRVLTGADRVREWSIADIMARLDLERFPNQVRLSWPVGELQHASDPGGPWRVVPDATSPATLPLTGAAVFFRASVDSPE